MAKERLFLGMFGGQACDGLDVAVVAVSGEGVELGGRLVAGRAWAYDEATRRLALRCAWEGGGVGELMELGSRVTALAVSAGGEMLKAARVSPGELAAVGWGGQRLAVAGGGAGGWGMCVEAGSAEALAGRLGVRVAAGFSAGQCALGGSGAGIGAWPLWRLLADARLSRVVVALGGVTELTFIPAAAHPDDVATGQVGPGTAMLDHLAGELLGQACDGDGVAAARGKVCGAMLHELLAHPQFQADGPRWLAAEAWGAVYFERLIVMGRKYRLDAADLLATANELIARSVAGAVGRLTETPHEVVLCGGGAMNIHLARRIRSLLSPTSTYPAGRYGLEMRAVTAECCALLAAARLDDCAAHSRASGGGRGPARLGYVIEPF